VQSLETETLVLGAWSIKTSNVTTSQLNARFVYQPDQWRSIRAGFWASARPDIIAGAITAGTILYIVELDLQLKQKTMSVYVCFVGA
jgi:predicted hotdog family 3-hydroxylacyl-ACP dehydratase